MILMMSLAATACVAADFSTGLHAYEKGDYNAAVAEWRPLAEKGDAPSQFNLGLLYIDGHGVPQDYSLAAHWFERAAGQDYTKAQLNLGAMYGIGEGVKRDYVLAYKWLNICAAKGDPKCTAQRDLVAKKLKSKDLATAQRLARDFKPQQEPGKENPDR
jgi:TPR repeat protein